MKNYLLILLMVLMTHTVVAQQTPSQWNVKSDQVLELNYNLLGMHTAQGAFYGAAGYGAGMWLSGNRTGWGLVGSIVTANLPILFEKRFDEPETVIGRNLGALSVGLTFTFGIEMSRRGKLNYTLPSVFQKR